jgi:hypothetical protein
MLLLADRQTGEACELSKNNAFSKIGALCVEKFFALFMSAKDEHYQRLTSRV